MQILQKLRESDQDILMSVWIQSADSAQTDYKDPYSITSSADK